MLRRGRIACSIYRGQTAAIELANAQIPAHSPIDNSVIADSDAALFSRAVACSPARWRHDGRCSADWEMTESACSDAVSLSTVTPCGAAARDCIAAGFNHNYVMVTSGHR